MVMNNMDRNFLLSISFSYPTLCIEACHFHILILDVLKFNVTGSCCLRVYQQQKCAPMYKYYMVNVYHYDTIIVIGSIKHTH